MNHIYNMSKIRTIILIMAFIPFFSGCIKINNGQKASNNDNEMEVETTNDTSEPLKGYKVFKIRRSNLLYGRDYVFPYIQMEDKEVERKVNAILQMQNFDVVFNGSDGSCVDGIDHIVRCSYEGKPRTKFYDNTFSRNIRIKLALTYRDGTDMYYYYNFNPKTGDLYHLQDFFSKENYYQFQSKLLGYEVTDDEDLVDFSDFEFNEEEIGILISLSSRFEMHEYLKTNISDIEPLLNDYGRAALITGEGLEKYHTKLPPFLYEGMIGDEPVYYLRDHPFKGDRDKLFFRNTGKFGELDGKLHFLEVPEEKETIIYDYEIARPNILQYCDSYWYDCQISVKHIEKDTAIFVSGDDDFRPKYVYKDYGMDLFCFHVTEYGLEGYYQTPYPSDHELKVSLFEPDEDPTEEYKDRIEKYGVKPQKYQVNLKKM